MPISVYPNFVYQMASQGQNLTTLDTYLDTQSDSAIFPQIEDKSIRVHYDYRVLSQSCNLQGRKI